MWVGIIQYMKGLNRTKRWRKCEFVLCLRWDIHLLLPLDISTPGFQGFKFRPGLISLAPLVPRPSGLD